MVKKIKSIYKKSKIFRFLDKIENQKCQKRLINHNFSLLTPNCMGGLIYHRLGEKFNSPTIDLSIQTHEFIMLISDMDYYFSQDIVQIKNKNLACPCGLIKGDANHEDVVINFVHYDSFDYAREKWNQRKARIIKENLYILLCDIEDIYQVDSDKAGFINDCDLKLLESVKCNNMALLTRDDKRNLSYSYYIKPEYNKPNPLTYLNRNLFGKDKYERCFDFVSFINKGVK